MTETTVQHHIPASDQGDPAPRASRVKTLLRRGWAAGLVISVCIHLIILMIAAVVRIGFGTGDAGGVATEPVEFAVMTEIELAELSAPPELQSDSVVDQTEALSLASLAEMTPIESTATDVALDFEPSAGSGDPLASFAGDSGSGGAGLGASFFGLEAQGRRFVFIIDVSTSMNSNATRDPGGPTRLTVTKRELAQTISELIETSEFSVLLFAGDTGALFPRTWLPATEQNKVNARRRIAVLDTDTVSRFGVSNTGNTRPIEAFERVFRMRPRPDAVYFMTDGEFNEKTPEVIKERNARARIPIHTILFTDPRTRANMRSEPLLQTIARESGGRYAFVSGSGQ